MVRCDKILNMSEKQKINPPSPAETQAQPASRLLVGVVFRLMMLPPEDYPEAGRLITDAIGLLPDADGPTSDWLKDYVSDPQKNRGHSPGMAPADCWAGIAFRLSALPGPQKPAAATELLELSVTRASTSYPNIRELVMEPTR